MFRLNPGLELAQHLLRCAQFLVEAVTVRKDKPLFGDVYMEDVVAVYDVPPSNPQEISAALSKLRLNHILNLAQLEGNKSPFPVESHDFGIIRAGLDEDEVSQGNPYEFRPLGYYKDIIHLFWQDLKWSDAKIILLCGKAAA